MQLHMPIHCLRSFGARDIAWSSQDWWIPFRIRHRCDLQLCQDHYVKKVEKLKEQIAKSGTSWALLFFSSTLTCNCQKMYQHLTCLTCLFNQSPGMTYSDSFRLSWRLCITANPLFFLDCGATLETSEARTEHVSFEAHWSLAVPLTQNLFSRCQACPCPEAQQKWAEETWQPAGWLLCSLIRFPEHQSAMALCRLCKVSSSWQEFAHHTGETGPALQLTWTLWRSLKLM